MTMEKKYFISIIGDKTKNKNLYNDYSFLDNAPFEIESNESNAHFYIFDIDSLDEIDNIEQIMYTQNQKTFNCRPFVFASNINGKNSPTVNSKLIQFSEKHKIPVCQSQNDIKNYLTWFRFMFDKEIDPTKLATNFIISAAGRQ